MIYENGEVMDEHGKDEIEAMMNYVEKMLADLYNILQTPNDYNIDRVFTMEDAVNRIEKQSRKAFIERLKNQEEMGNIVMALYVDILSDFERIGDYTYNVANRLKETVLS